MNTVTLRPADIHHGSLILVNRAHPLCGQHDRSLVPVGLDTGDSVLLESRAAAMLGKLLQAVGGAGEIACVSGWRSQVEQEQLYADSLRENGAGFTSKYVALPGCSEHQTGFAVDVAQRAAQLDFIRPCFPDEGVCRQFRKRAAEHGFVLRYGADKEAVTGIAHESWHFRYVGYPHAGIMQAHGFSLEEYIDFLREATKPVLFVTGSYRIEVSYIAAQGGETVLPAFPPDTASHQLSGNNVDGFVLTVWRHSYGAA